MSTVSTAYPGVRTRFSAEGARAASRAAEPALAGTLAACLGLASGRWGSYLGHSPIYLTDVLFVAACVKYVWRREQDRDTVRRRAPTGVLVAFGAWALFRFVLGGRLDLVALRDAVPYAYVLAGILSGAALVRSSAAARERTARFLTWALGFHAAWFFLVTVVWQGLPNLLPTLSTSEAIHIFTPRNDFDTTMVGVYAALLVARTITNGCRWTRLAGLAMCAAAVGMSPSRPGVVAAVVAVLAVLLAAGKSIRLSYQTRMALAGVVVITIGAVLIALPLTVPGKRVLATFGIMPTTHAGERAIGTTRARERAWHTVLGYSYARPVRAVAGVGFGPDFMATSGALSELTSTPDADTRAPHSWWVDLQARLGIVGLVLALLLTGRVVLRVGNLAARSSGYPDLCAVASLVVISLIPALSVGVIMESPFGAFPFYWCAGIVLSYRAVLPRI